MEKTTKLKDVDVAAERERLRGLFEKMLAEKKEYQRTAPERFENDPILKESFEKLKKRNEERGTPIIRL